MPAGSGYSPTFIKTCIPRVISSWPWCVFCVVCWCVLHWLLALHLVSSETLVCWAWIQSEIVLCELNSQSPLHDGLTPWCCPHVPSASPPALNHSGGLYQTMLYHIQVCLGLGSRKLAPALWLCLRKCWAERKNLLSQCLLCGCWCSLMWALLCQRAAG